MKDIQRNLKEAIKIIMREKGFNRFQFEKDLGKTINADTILRIIEDRQRPKEYHRFLIAHYLITKTVDGVNRAFDFGFITDDPSIEPIEHLCCSLVILARNYFGGSQKELAEMIGVEPTSVSECERFEFPWKLRRESEKSKDVRRKLINFLVKDIGVLTPDGKVVSQDPEHFELFPEGVYYEPMRFLIKETEINEEISSSEFDEYLKQFDEEWQKIDVDKFMAEHPEIYEDDEKPNEPDKPSTDDSFFPPENRDYSEIEDDKLKALMVMLDASSRAINDNLLSIMASLGINSSELYKSEVRKAMREVYSNLKQVSVISGIM